MIIKKKLSEREKLEFLTHGGKTRREFLEKTAKISFASILAPSLLTLLDRKLLAQSCPSIGPGSGSSIILPWTEYHAGGGGAFGEDLIGLDQGGQLLTSYELAGIPPDDHPAVSGLDRSLAAPFHPRSAFLRGFNERLAELGATSIKDNMAVISVAVESRSDNLSNPISSAHMPSALGLVGSITATVGTSGGRDSGGHHELVQGTRNQNAMPVVVNNRSTAQQIGGRGRIVDNLGENQARAIRTAMSSMSRAKLSTFESLSTEQQVRVLVDCGYINSVQIPDLYTPSVLDPGQNAVVNASFRDNNSRTAALFHMVSGGFAGAGVASFGDYDTHNGTASTSYEKRRETGRRFAETFAAAAATGSGMPYAMSLLTDGHMGVVRNGGIVSYEDVGAGDGTERARRPGDSDRLMGTQMMFVYIPGKTHSDILRDVNKTQVGWYKSSNQEVDRDSSLAATSPSMAGMVLFANWLALQGREDDIALYNRGQNPFSSDISKYILMKKVV